MCLGDIRKNGGQGCVQNNEAYWLKMNVLLITVNNHPCLLGDLWKGLYLTGT